MPLPSPSLHNGIKSANGCYRTSPVTGANKRLTESLTAACLAVSVEKDARTELHVAAGTQNVSNIAQQSIIQPPTLCPTPVSLVQFACLAGPARPATKKTNFCAPTQPCRITTTLQTKDKQKNTPGTLTFHFATACMAPTCCCTEQAGHNRCCSAVCARIQLLRARLQTPTAI
jgi:hypothetical protein